MKGANLTYELCGQDLFTLITGILYQKNRQPSEVHKFIARLAHPQWVPDRQQPGFLPGWDAIVTYNFDNFMSIALEEEGVPSLLTWFFYMPRADKQHLMCLIY